MSAPPLPWSTSTKSEDGTSTLAPSPSQRLRIRRSRAIILGTAAVLVLLLSFIAFSQVQILRKGLLTTVRPERNTSIGVTPVPVAPPRMFIGIKSSPLAKYQQRRAVWRQSGCAERYRDAGIEYRFFIGRPLVKGNDRTAHHQGTKDPLEMREAEKALQRESDEFGDISVLAIRDAYKDISHKLLGLLRYGFQYSTAQYIVRHDDEYCMDVDAAFDVIEAHEKQTGEMRGSELYAGTYMFRGDEYESMKGAEGEIAPFMSGWCTIFSRGLLRYILEVDWTHTVLFAIYGTSSEDANSGKWVKYAQEKHGLRVEFRSKRMVEDVEKMANSSRNDAGGGSGERGAVGID